MWYKGNGNPLDEYTSEAQLFHQKFKVAPGKLTGWKRLVGQEVPLDAESDLCTIAGASAWCAPSVGLLLNAGGAAPVAPVNASLTARRQSKILNGPQTPKVEQNQLDMWIPLLFWFNKDARLSIPSVAIPYGQRFITIDMESQSNMVYTAAGNLFLRLTTEVFANSDGSATGTNITSYARCQRQVPVVLPSSLVNTSQRVLTVDLYINNIFVNPEIKSCCL